MINRKNKQLSLKDIAEKIPKLVNDDEILHKITLNYISELQKSLRTPNQMRDFQSFQEILSFCWPYSFEKEYDHNNIQELNSSEAPSDNEVQFNHKLNTDLNDKSKKRMLEPENLNTLILIQRKFGEKIKLSELAILVKNLSKKTGIPCHKKDRLSKERITTWLSQNWDIFELLLDDEIAQLRQK